MKRLLGLILTLVFLSAPAVAGADDDDPVFPGPPPAKTAVVRGPKPPKPIAPPGTKGAHPDGGAHPPKSLDAGLTPSPTGTTVVDAGPPSDGGKSAASDGGDEDEGEEEADGGGEAPAPQPTPDEPPPDDRGTATSVVVVLLVFGLFLGALAVGFFYLLSKVKKAAYIATQNRDRLDQAGIPMPAKKAAKKKVAPPPDDGDEE